MHVDNGHKLPPPIVFTPEGWQPRPSRPERSDLLRLIENALIVVAVCVALMPVAYGLYSWAHAKTTHDVLPRHAI